MKKSLLAAYVSVLALVSMSAYASDGNTKPNNGSDKQNLVKALNEVEKTNQEISMSGMQEENDRAILIQQLIEMKRINQQLFEQVENQQTQVASIKLLVPILIEIKNILGQIERRG